MIKYTIICPNCNETREFEKQYLNGYERKFCNKSCASIYNNKKTWADPKVRAKRIKGITEQHNAEEYRRNTKASWTPERRAGAAQRAKDTYYEKVGQPGAYEKMCETKRSEACRELARQQAYERWSNPKWKAKRVEEMRELAQTEEYRDAMSKGALAGWKDNPERREATSKRTKKLWSDPKWAAAAIQNLKIAQRIKPTKPEIALFYLLNENNYPYVYIGDFGLWIGGKNPDFIWPEKRLLIEMFGSYWHDESEIIPRTKHLANYGFDTLIIWDYELDNEVQLLTRLKEFHQGIKLIE